MWPVELDEGAISGLQDCLAVLDFCFFLAEPRPHLEFEVFGQGLLFTAGVVEVDCRLEKLFVSSGCWALVRWAFAC